MEIVVIRKFPKKPNQFTNQFPDLVHDTIYNIH